jgi:hypothetical protein
MLREGLVMLVVVYENDFPSSRSEFGNTSRIKTRMRIFSGKPLFAL